MLFDRKENLFVGEAGSMPISLPLFIAGKGEPKVLIVVGLHGDEHTGLLVVHRLLQRIRLQRGTVCVVPAGNPLGQALKQREEPLTRRDPNRAFPGKQEGVFVERLAATLLKTAHQCQYVIDLHTMGAKATRLTAIFMNHGGRETREKSLALIRAFAPDIIWQLDTRAALGRTWGGSMGPTMAMQGIANFAVEMNEIYFATTQEIQRAAAGLERVLHHLGMVGGEPPGASASAPPVVAYKGVSAAQAGIFLPKPQLLQAVYNGTNLVIQKGERIGTIIHAQNFAEIEVISPVSGHLIAIARRNFVNAGEEICIVGKPAPPWHILPDDTLAVIVSFVRSMAPETSLERQRLAEEARRKALQANADVTICEAAVWLAALPAVPAAGKLAKAFLQALPDVDDETVGRILGCIVPRPHQPLSKEAQIVQDILSR